MAQPAWLSVYAQSQDFAHPCRLLAKCKSRLTQPILAQLAIGYTSLKQTFVNAIGIMARRGSATHGRRYCMAKDSKDVSVADVILAAVGPASAVRVLRGIPGKSPREGQARLYLNLEFSAYVEIPKGEVLYSKAVPQAGSPLEVTYVWLNRDVSIQWNLPPIPVPITEMSCPPQTIHSDCPTYLDCPGPTQFPCATLDGCPTAAACPVPTESCPTDLDCSGASARGMIRRRYRRMW